MSIFNFKKEEKSHWESMLKETEIHMAYYQKGLEEQEQIIEFPNSIPDGFITLAEHKESKRKKPRRYWYNDGVRSFLCYLTIQE